MLPHLPCLLLLRAVRSASDVTLSGVPALGIQPAFLLSVSVSTCVHTQAYTLTCTGESKHAHYKYTCTHADTHDIKSYVPCFDELDPSVL